MKYKKTFLLPAAILLVVAALKPLHALAFLPADGGDGGATTSSPDTNSGRHNSGIVSDPLAGAPITPYYDIGNDKDFAYSNLDLNIYVNKVDAGQTFNVVIDNAAPDCYSNSASPNQYPDYTDNGAAPWVKYSILNASLNVVSSVVLKSGGCGVTGQLNYKIGADAKNVVPNGTLQHYDSYYIFRAEIIGGGQGENSFRVSVNSPSAADSPAVGYVGGAGKYAGYGYRMPNLADGNYFNSWITFGAITDCSELLTPNDTKAGTVSWYDLDLNHSWNPPPGPSPSMILYEQLINTDGSTSGNPWTVVEDYNGYALRNPSTGVQDTSGPTDGPYYQNGSYKTANFKVGYRYKALMANVGVRNTIRLRLSGQITGISGNPSEHPTVNNCYSFTCTTNPASQGGLVPNQSVSIDVHATNTGDAGWDPGAVPVIRMQKNVNGVLSYINLSGSSTGGSNVGPNGGKTTFTFNATAPATVNATKFIYFKMFIGTTAMKGSSCRTILSTGSCPVAGCTPPTSPSISAACGTTTVFIPKSSIIATWHPPPNTHTGGPTKITIVPVAIIITESGTSNSFTYTTSVDVGAGDNTIVIPTFSMWNAMLPQKSYDISLAVQGTMAGDSFAYNNNTSDANQWYKTGGNIASGPWWYGIAPYPGNPVSDCLQPSTPVCIGPSTADLEPGQSTNFSYSIKFTNLTTKSWPTSDLNGFNFAAVVTPGLYYVGPNPPSSTDIAAGPGDSTVSVTIPIRSDYQGYFGVQFRYQNTILSLGDWDGTCGLGTGGQPGENTPGTKPFLQVWGGDINTGGGFESQAVNGAFSCGSDYPDYVSPLSPSLSGNAGYGGIKTFAADDGTYGSLSDFGALSLGIIAKDSSKHINFGAQPTFANTQSPAGQLDSTQPDYCIKDFFDDGTQKTPAPLPVAPTGLSSLVGSTTGQYIASQPGVDSFNGGVVPAGDCATPSTKITLYVDGDIHITSNITYANWCPDNPDSAPSFTIIAKGNINIDPNVTRIDGLYIAQPTSPGHDGEFNDCADNSGNQFCNQQFVANGAVIARRIRPLRSVGTLSPDANPAFAPAPGHVPAEVFNYIPSMVIIAPNFNPGYNSLQGLFSLPPVF